MSLYEIYNIVFITSAILSGVLLVVAVLMFFKFNVPKLIGDLSGANARRAIENIRKQSRDTERELNKPNLSNRARQNKRVPSIANGQTTNAIRTARLYSIDKRDININSAVTTILADETTMLSDAGATTVLSDETTILSEASAIHKDEITKHGKDAYFFEIEQDIMIIFTEEEI